jgi:hypothetical protein
MKQRLNLPPDVYPVQSFFKGLNGANLQVALEHFAQGRGYNPENLSCVFPDGLSEDEGGPPERFGYVEFWTYSGNEDVRVPFADFLKYIRLVIDGEIAENPENSARLTELEEKIRDKFNDLSKRHLSYSQTT